MGSIFGDTDDITFGVGLPPTRPVRAPAPRMSEDMRPERAQDRDRPHTERPRLSQAPSSRDYTPRPRAGVTPMMPPTPLSLASSLTSLVSSMKPTYLPPLSPDILRLVLLSGPTVPDPLMLARTGDVTLLIGTGYSRVENAGKSYPTFADMRLVQSEKDHLAGWVLLQSGFDIELFQMMLETLGFPFVYGTRDVIAYIRDTVKDAVFLDKCRFFELFSPESEDRKIGDFSLKYTSSGLSISTGNTGYIDAIHTIEGQSGATSSYPALSRTSSGYSFEEKDVTFGPGEIIDIMGAKILRNTLKFTFDTFYRDEQSIGVVAGYALKDRAELGSSGVLTFVLEEDTHARAIVGHIFIDSRGFVHAYEMMGVHKQILKGIRHIYESSIMANPRIERGELVQTLRRELTKYCYLITGRTPVVMPIIIER